ncbi:hypothetical protein CXG81DRAFT_1889, partial [Caulochytrium protostelioides]
KAVNDYDRKTQAFLKTLLVFVHLTSGLPMRGPEISSTRWCNTESVQRNTFIVDGRVAMFTTYHKSLNVTGQMARNWRFLHPTTGALILYYQAYVVPFRDSL